VYMPKTLTELLRDLLRALDWLLHGNASTPRFDQNTTSELQKSCEFINSALSDPSTQYPKKFEKASSFFALSKTADTSNRIEDISQFFNTHVRTSTRVVSAEWVAKGAFVVELQLAERRLKIRFNTVLTFNDAEVSIEINLINE
jgi:hypothetical protein